MDFVIENRGGAVETDKVWCIQGGRVGTGTIRSRLAAPADRDLLLRAGAPAVGNIDTFVRIAAAEIGRMAPWVRLYIAPQAWLLTNDPNGKAGRLCTIGRTDDGRLFMSNAGCCLGADRRTMAISYSGYTLPYLMDTLYHEVFHACYRHLPPAEREILKTAAGQGVAWGDPYLDDLEETGARLFALWAMQFCEGLPNRSVDLVTPSAERTFVRIYNGYFAAEAKGCLMAPEQAAA